MKGFGTMVEIHETALVSPRAVLEDGVSIGPFAIVHDNVRIGAGTTIGSHCEIGFPAATRVNQPLSIGAGSLIRSHSVLYEGSSLGSGLVTGHRVTVREGTVAGTGVQIGTLSDLQGSCVIGDYTRFHSNVHIGQGSTVGDYVWIFPYVVLTNDPHPPSEVQLGVNIHDFAAIATMSVVLPGVTVGKGALVAAHSSVTKDVEPDTVVAGVPARFLCETSAIKSRGEGGGSAYPWRYSFHRGYPQQVVEGWLREAEASENRRA